VLRESGVERDNIREAAELLAKSRATIFVGRWVSRSRPTRRRDSNDLNILLLGAHFGRKRRRLPGSRHSNVQGDRTMGILREAAEGFHRRARKEFEYDEFPYEHGVDAVEAIHQNARESRSRVLRDGRNFVSATPTRSYTADALRRTLLTVHVSTKLNRFASGHRKARHHSPGVGPTERDSKTRRTDRHGSRIRMSVVSMSHGT